MKSPLGLLLSLLLAAPSGATVRAVRPVPSLAGSPFAAAARVTPSVSFAGPSLLAGTPSLKLVSPADSARLIVAGSPSVAAAAPAILAAPADAPRGPDAPAGPSADAPSARGQLAALDAAPDAEALWTGAADAKRAKAQLTAAHWQTFKFFMGSRVGLLRSMIKEQEAASKGRDRAVKDLEGMWVAWRTRGYSGRVQTAGFEVADRATVRREAMKVWDKYYPKDPEAKAAFLRYMARVESFVPAARPSNYRKLAFGAFFLTPVVPVADLAARIDAMLSESHLAAIAKHRAERQDAVVASFRAAVLASIREVNAGLPAGKKIVAVSMLGSYAIGQSTPDSDVDYQLITQDGGADGLEPFKAALDRHWTENRLEKIEAFQFALPPSPEVVRASFNEGYRIISPDPAAVAALSTDTFTPPAPTAWSRLRGRLFAAGYKAWILLNFRLADLREKFS
ncbi:MAG: hypothetical protein SF051_14415 [Elusimicrobiota bacterium]|nr:hypothetical protein [Elusimicrobiota bacterium]